jgi:hypothetical protein
LYRKRLSGVGAALHVRGRPLGEHRPCRQGW